MSKCENNPGADLTTRHDYDVGYGKPPALGRFKPGQSGKRHTLQSDMFATTSIKEPVIGIGIPPIMSLWLVIKNDHFRAAERIKTHSP